MSKEPPVKTLMAMMLGFALAAVGLDSVTGTLRMTYGQESLLKGFDFLIAVIGLFGIGEILLTMEEGLAFKGHKGRISLKDVLDTWKELPKYWATSLRGTALLAGIRAKQSNLHHLPKHLFQSTQWQSMKAGQKCPSADRCGGSAGQVHPVGDYSPASR